jgi:hypothetical protein
MLNIASHVGGVRWLNVLTLETFRWYLLLLSVPSLVVINVPLKSFGAVWLLSFVVTLRHQIIRRISTCCSWSHRHTRACTSSRGIISTLCHPNSRWRFELFNRLSVSHPHILLLVGRADCLILSSLVLLLLIHISAWMQSTSGSLIVTRVSWSISSRSCSLTTFLLWVQTTWRPYTHVGLLWVILILHLIILVLVISLIIFTLFCHSCSSLIICMVLLSLCLILILVWIKLLITHGI